MDFGAFLTGSVFDVVLAIVAFIGVLSVIVFVHEYGHFKTARLCGVKVETFSIGFGRSIGGFIDRYGTHWKIGWLPLGGYVKFAGDANAASMPSEEALTNSKPGDFHAAALWRRALIVVAGPMANFALAIVIFTSMFMLAGIPITQPKVASVVENSAASKAGFLAGDLITEIDGRKIESFMDVQRIVSVSAGAVMLFKVERAGESIELQRHAGIQGDCRFVRQQDLALACWACRAGRIRWLGSKNWVLVHPCRGQWMKPGSSSRGLWDI